MKKFLNIVLATGAMLTLTPAWINASAAQIVQPLPETVQIESTTPQTIAPTPEQIVQSGTSEQTVKTGTEQSPKSEEIYLAPSDYSKIAIPQVRNYMNVREEANTDSSVVGKMTSDTQATILDTVDGEDGKWYKIRSGNVTGYVKASLCVTGEEAAKAAKESGTGKSVAEVKVDTLNVRKSASTDSAKLTTVERGDTYEVLGEEDGFLKIRVNGSVTGYVASQYVNLTKELGTAVAVETEKKEETKTDSSAEQPEENAENSQPEATQEKPTEENKPAEESKAEESKPEEETTAAESTAAAETKFENGSAKGPGSGGSSFGKSESGDDSSSGTVSATRQEVVKYAKQFVGNPYVYGGTSLTNGADCSGFTMSVFKHFGISIGRSSRDQADNGKEVAISKLRPGDLIFYGSSSYINHVALYIGGGEIVHASTAATGIKISNYDYKTPVKAVSFLD